MEKSSAAPARDADGHGYITTELFGGAMVADFPVGFGDVRYVLRSIIALSHIIITALRERATSGERFFVFVFVVFEEDERRRRRRREKGDRGSLYLDSDNSRFHIRIFLLNFCVDGWFCFEFLVFDFSSIR